MKPTIATISLVTAMILQGMTLIDTAEAGSCGASAGGWGFGGVSANCTYTCEVGDTLSITVESSDNDAAVSGETECGGNETGCAGIETCTGTSATSLIQYAAPAEGTCHGQSDEAIDSSLAVECSSSSVPLPPPNFEWCPVTIKMDPPAPTLKVCVDPLPPFAKALAEMIYDACPLPQGASEATDLVTIDSCSVTAHTDKLPGVPKNHPVETLVESLRDRLEKLDLDATVDDLPNQKQIRDAVQEAANSLVDRLLPDGPPVHQTAQANLDCTFLGHHVDSPAVMTVRLGCIEARDMAMLAALEDARSRAGIERPIIERAVQAMLNGDTWTSLLASEGETRGLLCGTTCTVVFPTMTDRGAGFDLGF